jgi:tetratricopeptide (TPR) repeat protein
MFEEARALHLQGRLEDAARLYAALLTAEPAHVAGLVHFGALRLSQGQPAEAALLLRRAAGLADTAEVHGNLAVALQALGRQGEAVESYRRAVALRPDMVDAHFGLAGCLQAMGAYDSALASYGAVLAIQPDHPEAHFGMAELFARDGRAADAMAHYRAALAADADFAEASHGLGMLLVRVGRPEDAVGCFRQALDVDADYLEARLGLGRALRRLERDEEAMAAYRTVLESDPDNIDAQYGLATGLTRRHREEAAIQHFQRVLTLEPDHVEAMAGMAGALTALNRHAEAIALCRSAIEVRPGFARAHSVVGLALAQIGEMAAAEEASRRAVALAPQQPQFCYFLTHLAKVRRGDPVIAALEAMLPRIDMLSPRERCWVHFALAKSYDDIGERDRGFAQLLDGNAARRRQIDYQEARELGAMDRIREVFTADLLAARRGLGDPSDLPVFIVGMPRSGTTLVEQVLASHHGVFGAGEWAELPATVERLTERLGSLPFPEAMWTLSGADLRQIGAAYVAALRPLAPEAERITDKMPANFRFAGLIPLILPRARIIHVVRDPVDTCLSCFSKVFEGEQGFSYDLGELGRFHRAYQRLMAHWRTVLPADVLLEVRYEDMVADLDTQARRIVAHCGLTWDAACLQFHKTPRAVHTASVIQVRQPIYRDSVGRWRPDAALLRPLLAALGA